MPSRALCFASLALLAGCSHSGAASTTPTVIVLGNPSSSANVATTAAVPARALPCWSNEDCGANHGGGFCMPKASSKELADAQDFVERALRLHDLVASLADPASTAELPTILREVKGDLVKYSHMAHGDDADGPAQPTRDQMKQMQDAAWLQSGATQANVLIQQFAGALAKAPLSADRQKVLADIAGDASGLHLDKLTADLPPFVKDVEAAAAETNQLLDARMPDGSLPGLDTAAGAMRRYVGPLTANLNDAAGRVKAALNASAGSPLESELTRLGQAHDLLGKDGIRGTCLGSR